jgi:outer membrane protein TolC
MIRHWVIALTLGIATKAVAQDSLRLGALHQQALSSDPRQRQFALLDRQANLRLHNLAAEWLPSISAEASVQHQSTVFEPPPGTGLSFPTPSKDMYDSRLAVQQAIWKPSIGPRRAAERAQLAESQAHVRSTLFGLREEVNDAFFAAALLEQRIAITANTITDLERRLREASERVRAGAALPSDTAAIQATLFQRRQDQVELGGSRRAALARLAQLTGLVIAERDLIVLPDLAGDVATVRGGIASLRARPEYDVFARTRDRLSREEHVTAAALWPEVSAFARVGYGRPGLNPLNNRFDTYTVAGVQLSWAPWTWGSNGRERQVLALQREVVAADEAAFASSLSRSIQEDLATLDRLDTTLAMDDQIILLRERVELEARPRFQEGVITASAYLDLSTDVLEARLAQATHRVQLAQARARFLTTLGLEIR